MTIWVPVSLGELVDKITILEIKTSRIDDPEKIHFISTELALLTEVLEKTGLEVPEVLRQELYSINLSLWKIEEEIRERERRADFGEAFIELSRAICQTNDMRSLLKHQIAELDGASSIREQKSYLPTTWG